jgi:galactokinase
MRSFEEVFGRPPEVRAEAPGRVNLLGEHTDYNDGYVLPTTIPQVTRVELSRSGDARSRVYSANLRELAELADAPQRFVRYVRGCIEVVRGLGAKLEPLLVGIDSEIPIGVGLSSSAALEVALLRALRRLFHLPIDDVQIARLAQQAEIEYAGVRCGILDQMASSLGVERHMLFLDTRTLSRRLLPLPEAADLIVLDSGVSRELASTAYNQRRSECEAAALRLGVHALRDVPDLGHASTLPPPLDRRVRHVVTENARVLEAASGVDAARFGELMNASHASLRDDYEVSVPAVDTLVAQLQSHGAVYGARLTGAGFGGACIALVRKQTGDRVRQDVLAGYERAGHRGRVLV